MSGEAKAIAKDQGDRHPPQQSEKPLLNTPEGQQVRNTGGEHARQISHDFSTDKIQGNH